ncbi:hypothetical protein [Ralstonia phage RP12]|uniref:Uncharacterized protein n=1 Tax=Ralstonia phage RP12 TaxID=1923889 RepID=A0A1L7N0T2_9CAUD|nr:hypothetical protein FDH28_gp102 [Ralstonia phage RP12]BAW19076.1 hypothetical protein [Ralstonia phage RP12]
MEFLTNASTDQKGLAMNSNVVWISMTDLLLEIESWDFPACI